MSTPSSQEELDFELHDLLRNALLEIRILARRQNATQIVDLVSAIHNMPTHLSKKDLDVHRLANDLNEYQSKYAELALFDYQDQVRHILKIQQG